MDQEKVKEQIKDVEDVTILRGKGEVETDKVYTFILYYFLSYFTLRRL